MGGRGWEVSVNCASSQCAETMSTAAGVRPISPGMAASEASRVAYAARGGPSMYDHGPPPCELKYTGRRFTMATVYARAMRSMTRAALGALLLTAGFTSAANAVSARLYF